MPWTNTLNLPKPLCRAIEYHRQAYTKLDADVSVTELIGSPLISVLKQRHQDEIVRDYSDSLWSMYGSVAHAIIEGHGTGEQGEHVERLGTFTYDGWKVKYQIDHLVVADRMDDYKLTSGWSLMDGLKPEWEAQENLYLFGMRNSDNEEDRAIAEGINELNLIGMCRDWGPRMASLSEGPHA